VGQASSLSITDDGQDARPTGNLGFGGVPRDAGLRSARNDVLLSPVSEGLLQFRCSALHDVPARQAIVSASLRISCEVSIWIVV
jgi:hypothetical protein